MDKNLPLVIIGGPTASGKTALAVALAKEYNAEIVSCDSMQIYKYMDIGTAKPSVDEMQGVPHHMIDIAEPGENYSVYDYKKDACRIIDSLHAKNTLPIMVGGTGFYISAVTDNIEFTEFENNIKYRTEMYDYIEKNPETGIDTLYRKLGEVDPEAAENIHPNNVKRVVRALEVYYASGKTMTYFNEQSKKIKTKYNICYIVLAYRDRAKLYERIDVRVDGMLSAGLLDEVKMLLLKGYARDTTAMQAIGYRQWFDYLDGKISYDAAVEILKRDSRRYAKRQMTWFRRIGNAHVIYIDEKESFQNIQNKCRLYIEKIIKV